MRFMFYNDHFKVELALLPVTLHLVSALDIRLTPIIATFMLFQIIFAFSVANIERSLHFQFYFHVMFSQRQFQLGSFFPQEPSNRFGPVFTEWQPMSWQPILISISQSDLFAGKPSNRHLTGWIGIASIVDTGLIGFCDYLGKRPK